MSKNGTEGREYDLSKKDNCLIVTLIVTLRCISFSLFVSLFFMYALVALFSNAVALRDLSSNLKFNINKIHYVYYCYSRQKMPLYMTKI